MAIKANTDDNIIDLHIFSILMRLDEYKRTALNDSVHHPFLFVYWGKGEKVSTKR